MSAIVVRNLSEETHRALKSRAAANGRSTEAEVRLILDATVRTPERVRMGSLLASIGQDINGADLDISRSKSESLPPDFA